MKLGIVVVYLVNEEDGKLLDLHLGQIAKYTTVPYTIYGSANRLLPRFRQRLQRQPQVKICDCPSTELRGSKENAHYLEQLTKFAITDNASHIVTLHVDSFPVRNGWAEELAEKISDDCPFATIERIHTACLFFQSDFYIKYQPRFLVSANEKATPEYQRFLQECHPFRETGVGYGFKASAAGLSWYSLPDSSKTPGFGRIYDDLVFHLGGAVRIAERSFTGRNLRTKPGFARFLDRSRWLCQRLLPKRFWDAWIWKLLRLSFNAQMEFMVDTPRFLQARKLLLANPESYLQRLRQGRTVNHICQ